MLAWAICVVQAWTAGRKADAGATLVEYALLLALVAIASIVALQFLGGSLSNSINTSGSSLFNSP